MVEKTLIVQHEDDMEKIKIWLAKQPHLPQKIDDALLLRFLHTCSFSLEKTKHLIDLFFTVRSQAPEIFADRDPRHSAIENMLEVIDLVPLPKPTKDNCKVLIYRLRDYEPDHFVFADAVKTFFMMSDTRMMDSGELTSGEIPIFDMAGFSLRHLTKLTLPILKKYMVYSQEAAPIRLRQIHLLNAPPFLDRCLALVKPLMKPEVGRMLHFHQPDSQTLFEHIDRHLVPVEYGGTLEGFGELKKHWVQKVNDNREYFTDEERWRLDETKRPMDNANGRDVFGIQGSFRSLTID